MKILVVIIGILGLCVCVMNYVSIGVSLYNKRHGIDRFVSPIPLVSGIMMLAAAFILLPVNIRALGFLAFMLDHTYPLPVYSIIETRFFTRYPKEKK